MENRRTFIIKVVDQIAKIYKRKHSEEGLEFDRESFNWLEDYNLIGLDPLTDLKEVNIPLKEGVVIEEDEPQMDEEGNEIPRPPKAINPDNYNLGIEDIGVYVKR